MTAATEAPPLRRGLDLAQGWRYRLLVLFVCAIAAHLLLSPLGFNPTDDGFILAQSRRILAGEIPHRDFISIRPAGSAYLHVGELLAGGTHTFLLSRFVYWLQVAICCWCWLEIVGARTRGQVGVLGTLPLAVVAFMLSTHAFPPMAWHTVDGILLASVGYLLASTGGRSTRLVGYLLLGGAAVCKQNFLPLVPLGVWLLGDTRRAAAWAAALALPVAYVAGLAAAGAGRALRLQLLAVTDIGGSGLHAYLSTPWFAGGVVLGVVVAGVTRWAQSRRGPAIELSSWIATLAAWAVVAFSARRLAGAGFPFLDHDAFLLLGGVIGGSLAWIGAEGSGPMWRTIPFAVALAWCSSLSLGYRTPAHAAGPLAILLTIAPLALIRSGAPPRLKTAWALFSVATMLLVAPPWWAARHDRISRERTAPLLRYDLGGVLPGGAGIRTNSETHAMLTDLRDTVQRLGGQPYAVVVDAPGWWACAPQRNPLVADWPQVMELSTDSLQTRFSASVLEHRERGPVLVQKANAVHLSEGFVPIERDNLYYGAANWVSRTLRRESESKYWAVYR